MTRHDDPQGCLYALLRLVLNLLGAPLPSYMAPATTPPPEPARVAFPFELPTSLLTPAERSLFGVLHTALGTQYLIFAKVRLADLVYIPRGTDRWQSHFNRIQSKHVDFVLCDPKTVRPVLAIELDDFSHARADRQDRDGFLNSALAAAGLPILRVPARAAYNPHELGASIAQAIKGQGA